MTLLSPRETTTSPALIQVTDNLGNQLGPFSLASPNYPGEQVNAISVSGTDPGDGSTSQAVTFDGDIALLGVGI